jgi:hypothetical protein
MIERSTSSSKTVRIEKTLRRQTGSISSSRRFLEKAKT